MSEKAFDWNDYTVLCENEVGKGKEPVWYTGLRVLSEWLYEALDTAQEIIHFLRTTAWLVLPGSGLAFKLMDGDSLNDFRLDKVEVWAIQMEVLGIKFPPMKLMKTEWGDMLTDLFWRMDKAIAGSENEYYRDPDTGTIKLGTEFSPVRQYHILSDGLRDIGPVIIAIAIISLFIKLKLHKTALAFIQKVYGAYQRFKTTRSVDSIQEDLAEFLDNDLGDIRTLEDLEAQTDRIEAKANTISAAVSLNLLLG